MRGQAMEEREIESLKAREGTELEVYRRAVAVVLGNTWFIDEPSWVLTAKIRRKIQEDSLPPGRPVHPDLRWVLRYELQDGPDPGINLFPVVNHTGLCPPASTAVLGLSRSMEPITMTREDRCRDTIRIARLPRPYPYQLPPFFSPLAPPPPQRRFRRRRFRHARVHGLHRLGRIRHDRGVFRLHP